MALGNPNLALQSSLTRCVVCLHVGDQVAGTGFFVDRRGSILTCFHVIGNPATGERYPQPISASFQGQRFEVDCLFESPDLRRLDFAILCLQRGSLPPGAALLPLGAWQDDGEHHEFASFGFRSRHLEGVHARGRILGETGLSGVRKLQLSTEASNQQQMRQGMSGAPIFDQHTQEIVALFEAFSTEQGQENIPIAIPLPGIAAYWACLEEILKEQALWKRLADSNILAIGGQRLAEDAFRLIYEGFPYLKRYEQLDEDKTADLLEQIQRQGRISEFFDYLEAQHHRLLVRGLWDYPAVAFINREREKERACGKQAPPYLFFEGPAGYGKTTLLRQVRKQHWRDGWFSIHLEITPNLETSADLLAAIVAAFGFTEVIPVRPRGKSLRAREIEHIANSLATLLRDRAAVIKAKGILIVLDNAERLPETLVKSFCDVFVPTLFNALGEVDAELKLRLRVAGRYVGEKWKEQASRIALALEPLTPFAFEYVQETVRSLLPGQKPAEAALCAAHLMHVTGGHPRCMAEIIQNLERVGGLAGDFFSARQEQHTRLLIETAEEIRREIPASLRETLDTLSVFRFYNYLLLKDLIEAGQIRAENNHFALEEKLTAAYMVKREEGFLQDEITRRLLALRLKYLQPQAYLELCCQARRLYQDYLERHAIHTNRIVLACLHLELLIAEQEQNLPASATARRLFKSRFFVELLPAYLSALDAKDADLLPGLKTELKELLEKDWELRFMLNYNLRARNYTDAPYKTLMQHINAWWAIGRNPQED